MTKAVLVYLLRGGSVALGRKSRKVAAGFLTAAGGKLLEGETPLQAATREVREESGVVVRDLQLRAVIRIHNLDRAEWDCELYVYVSRNWTGRPSDSEEMTNWEWYRIDDLPWNEIRGPDKEWLEDALTFNDTTYRRLEVEGEQVTMSEILNEPIY